MQGCRESHPSGTDGDGKTCGSAAQAQASARVDVPTAPHFFLQCGPRSPRCMYMCFFCENAWICARRTKHHDLASAIPDKKGGKKRERERGRQKRKQCKSETVVIFSTDLMFFELIRSLNFLSEGDEVWKCHVSTQNLWNSKCMVCVHPSRVCSERDSS